MVIQIMPYKGSAYGHSDIGLVRQNNEDFWQGLAELHFFALADGMGGHRAGEVASKEAVTSLCDIIQNSLSTQKEHLTMEEMHGVMQLAYEEVNKVVYRKSRSNYEYRGMGTTLCSLYFHEQGLISCHVGDSRIYRQRNGMLEQLTKDDSLVREMIDSGRLSIDEVVKGAAYKSIITKAIGTEPNVEPSVHTYDLVEEDIFLMCSDGLSDMLTSSEIEEIINAKADVKKCVKELISTAKERGGFDNVTVVLIKVHDFHEKKDLSR